MIHQLKTFCKRCDTEKSPESFSKGQKHCKQCSKKLFSEYYEKNKDRIKREKREKRLLDVEAAREKENNYRNDLRKRKGDEIRRKEKEYREKNADKVASYPSLQNDYTREKQREKRADPEYRKKLNERHRKYFEKYPEKKKEKNERRRLTRSEYEKSYLKSNPSALIAKRIRGFVSELRVGKKKTKKSLDFIGLSSYEELLEKFNEKSCNKNWIQDGWHIDHIWQINWFLLTEENWEDISHLINHHSNLFPASQEYNLRRGKLDFSPLKKEDFPKYELYLKPEIREKIKDYFNNV